MSDTQNATQAPAPAPALKKGELKPAFIINRNGVDVQFYETPFSRAGEDLTNVKFPSVGPASYVAKNLDAIIKFLGDDYVASAIASKFRATCSNIAEEACDDVKNADGQPMKNGKGETEADWSTFNKDQFIKDMQDLSVRGESIPDLKAQVMQLATEMGDLDPTADDYGALVAKIGLKMKSLTIAIETKRRDRAASLNAPKATPVS